MLISFQFNATISHSIQPAKSHNRYQPQPKFSPITTTLPHIHNPQNLKPSKPARIHPLFPSRFLYIYLNNPPPPPKIHSSIFPTSTSKSKIEKENEKGGKRNLKMSMRMRMSVPSGERERKRERLLMGIYPKASLHFIRNRPLPPPHPTLNQYPPHPPPPILPPKPPPSQTLIPCEDKKHHISSQDATRGGERGGKEESQGRDVLIDI